jgi:hypothetical protein
MAIQPSLHIHVQSFGRFDEITYLVEKTSDLTLARHPRVRRAGPTRLTDFGRKPPFIGDVPGAKRPAGRPVRVRRFAE